MSIPIPPKPPKWNPSSDINFYKRVSLEVANLYFREMKVHLIDRERTVVDPLYGESKNIHYTDFNIRAQCIIDPKKTVLTNYGLDDHRDLIVNIPKSVFEEGTGAEGDYPMSLGGFPLPLEGDIFILEDEWFRVMDETKIDYFWHEDKNLTHSFSCLRKRDRSVTDDVPVDENNTAGPTAVPKYTDEAFPGEEDEN
jgi:hypothetical protein